MTPPMREEEAITLPVVRTLPAMEFLPRRVLRSRDAPPWNLEPGTLLQIPFPMSLKPHPIKPRWRGVCGEEWL